MGTYSRRTTNTRSRPERIVIIIRGGTHQRVSFRTVYRQFLVFALLWTFTELGSVSSPLSVEAFVSAPVVRPSIGTTEHYSRSVTTTSSTILFGRSKKKKKPSDNIVTLNRIAYRNYEIIETLEAGVSLKGTEIKSIRDGKINLRDGYVRPTKNGRSCVLYNVHISKCSQVGSDYFQHEEKRPRSLLLHKEEARKLMQRTEQQGMTIVPLKAYWNEQNKLKVQIGLARGKNVRDKRETIRERDSKRETNRIIKNFRV